MMMMMTLLNKKLFSKLDRPLKLLGCLLAKEECKNNEHVLFRLMVIRRSISVIFSSTFNTKTVCILSTFMCINRTF